MITVPVLNTEGKEVEKLKLDAKIFDGGINEGILYQTVVGYLANKRRGLASTKTRGEVSGGGRKPWRQKGTGRARVGSIRSPLWRGGGVVFGPHPRDFKHDIPKQIKRQALRFSLNSKFSDKSVVVVDKIKLSPRTKEFADLLKKLKLKGKILFLLGKNEKENALAAANFCGVSIRSVSEVNAYDILSFKKLLLSVDSVKELTRRLQ